MTDLRERLKEALKKSVEYVGEKCSGRYCRDCEYDKYGDDCEANAMVDSLIANGVTIQRWIPVTERLPDLELVDAKTDDNDLFPCLVSRKHQRAKKGKYVAKAWYDGCGFIDGDSVDVTDEVTHWMPLPETPGDCHGLRPRNDGEVAGDG